MKLKTGKLPNDLLKNLILANLPQTRREVVAGPAVGEDCCAVDPGAMHCVLTTDPVTAAMANAGRIVVHICCNDLAASRAIPLGILLVMLMPPGTDMERVKTFQSQVEEASSLLSVSILGGHTEITDSVNRPVLVGTGIGLIQPGGMVRSSGVRPGDDLVMTRWAAMEGTYILATDYKDKLAGILTKTQWEEANALGSQISVVKEGLLAAAFGVHAMHDATEGGILGAVWELCEASATGVVVDREKIPVLSVTRELCFRFRLDPLKLISSGSMLIACQEGPALVQELQKQGIKATVIGRFNDSGSKLLHDTGRFDKIDLPDRDELYKISSMSL